MLIYSDFESVSAEDMTTCFKVNTLGPLLTSQALLNAGLLGGSSPSIVGNVTSKVGRSFQHMPNRPASISYGLLNAGMF